MEQIDVCEAARWYVVRTKPKQEARAEMNLRAWGVELLAPKVREMSARSRSGLYSIAPLFPCYLFARFDAAILLPKIRLTRGVHSVVGLGECATPVEDAIVDFIRDRVQDDGFVRIEEPEPGEVVKIVDGPLRTLTGVFQRRRGHDRAVILLALLGAQVHVEIAMAAVRRTAAIA
jgi:transcriptional antiterminator RfaH